MPPSGSDSSLRQIPGDCAALFETSSNRRTRQASARLHFRGLAKYVCRLFYRAAIVACIGLKGPTTRGRAPHGRESNFRSRSSRFEMVRSRQARDGQSDRLIKNRLLVAEGLLLRAAAGLDGDSKDWEVSGSVRQSKNHLAECEWIAFDLRRKRRLDDWYRDANLTTLDRIGWTAMG